jgi:hypothetical protein
MGVLLMPVAGALATWTYETAYFEVTGRSFLEIYRARQVPDGALTAGSPIVRSAYSLVWYTGRLAWFAFPWSIVGAVAVAAALRAGEWWPGRTGSGPQAPGSRHDVGQGFSPARQSPGEDVRQDFSPARHSPLQGAWFAALATIALVVAFSLAHRKADRYIFPAYFSAAALGGAYALARFPRVARFADLLDRPWLAPALHVVLVLLRLATRGALPEFTFWRS